MPPSLSSSSTALMVVFPILNHSLPVRFVGRSFAKIASGLALLLSLMSFRACAQVLSSEVELRARFQQDITPFLETYCGSCHAKDKPKGDFDLRPFKRIEDVIAEERRWKGVLDQVRESQMPPEEAKRQPSSEERQRFVSWIRDLRTFEGHRNAGDPGLVTARRLNQAEFDNTIRDLTGVDLHPAKEFPVDPANEAGFDNSGESLAMSPALLKKYLEAGRSISEHLLLTPTGFTFAPYPILSDTDRDKFCVRRIVDFYQRQRTNIADYIFAAWRFDHRAEYGRVPESLAELSGWEHLSAPYLQAVWEALWSKKEVMGPLAGLQAIYRTMPSSRKDEKWAESTAREMADLIARIRALTRVEVPTLRVHNMNAGTSAFVLWKDREMATHRRSMGGSITNLTLDRLGVLSVSPAAEALTLPSEPAARVEYEAAFKRFCALFPDAFYLSERGRVFLDRDEDKDNTGRLLSAGFHNQMGYFRDDAPLYDLILDQAGRQELDRLWDDFEFGCELPMRMHSGSIWFDRAESDFGTGPEFAFAHPADKDIVSEAKFRQYAEAFTAKVHRMSQDTTVFAAVDQYFRISEANIRRVEKQWLESEPRHIEALQEFAGRAYRRPLTELERADIAEFYQRLRTNEGAGHAEAVRDTLVSILLSPHFCYRLDLPMARKGKEPSSVEPLSDIALASRLSYFLWASMPDAELMRHAEAGDLHQPPVLLAQTHRMLRDVKVRGLATEFLGNWLDIRRFEEHNAVDRGRFPDFDHELRSAMFEEPIRLFIDLLQQTEGNDTGKSRAERSILDLLYGPSDIVNVRLARFYGLPVPGKEIPPSDVWWPVDDASDRQRGGLLSMAVFQTRNSPGLRTSPVKRGYWVVRRLLGEEIPPPPAKVPELPSDEAKLGTLTLRQTLEQHRSDKACAGCHARFDSIGLAFEGFGPIGERRTNDLAGHPIDLRTTFPGGMDGEGVEGVREYIRKFRQMDYVENFCRKLLAFGLGRTLQLSDEPTIDAMREDAVKNGYAVQRLMDGVVTSPQFLNQRRAIEVTKK